MELLLIEKLVLGYMLRHLCKLDEEIDNGQLEYLGVLYFKYNFSSEHINDDHLNDLDKVRMIIKNLNIERKRELISIIGEFMTLRKKEVNIKQINLAMMFINLLEGNKIAVIIDKGEVLSTIQDLQNIPWKSENIRRKAGISTWKQSVFYPEKGMVGEIIDSFQNPIFNFRVYILLIYNEYYVPISEKGIRIFE